MEHVLVPKAWGYEKIIVNSDKYCGKILAFVKGHRASFHYHKVKTETMYVKEGEFLLLYANFHEDLEKNKDYIGQLLELAEFAELQEDGIYHSHPIILYTFLREGDSFHINPCLVHQLIALSDSEIIEFSTHSDDSDSYRIVKGN